MPLHTEVLMHDDEVSGRYTFSIGDDIVPGPNDAIWTIDWSESDEAELTDPDGNVTILRLFTADAGALMQLVEAIAQATDTTP